VLARQAPVASGLVVLLIVGLLGACAPSAAPPPAASAPVAGGAASSTPASANAPGATPAAAAPALRTVKVGDLGILTTAALYVAMEQGYFREQGVETELVNVDGTTKAIPFLATGEMDAVAASAAAGLFNAIHQGLPMRIVADKALQAKDSGTVGLVGRQDLLDSGALRTVTDVRGRTVGLNTRGAALEYQLANILKSGGMTVDDVEVVELAMPDLVQALSTRRLDASMLIEPFQTITKRRGIASMWINTVDVMPEYQSGVIIYSQRLPERDAALANDWMVGYLRGIRAFEDARRKGVDRDAVIEIMMKYTAVKDRALYDEMVWPSFEVNGRVSAASLSAEQAYYQQLGMVPQPVAMDRVIDEQYVRAAVDKLGPYGE